MLNASVGDVVLLEDVFHGDEISEISRIQLLILYRISEYSLHDSELLIIHVDLGVLGLDIPREVFEFPEEDNFLRLMHLG